jgi:hypothetical protein
MRLVTLILSLAFLAPPALAQEHFLRVEDRTIFFDTGRVTGDWFDLSEDFALLIMDFPDVDTVHLTGPGGNFDIAMEIAATIRRYALNTVASGECSSACAFMFVAGAERTLMPGAELGFHRIRWREDASMALYEVEREYAGEDGIDPYPEWLYEDAQNQAARLIRLFSQAGIEPGFVARVLETSSSDIWIPSREELVESGIVDE